MLLLGISSKLRLSSCTDFSLYFLSINENSSSEFLKKLYSEDEFIFQSQDLKTLDYGLIKNKNLIILNFNNK